LGAMAIGASFPAPAVLAQQPIVIKFSHVTANDTPKGKGSLRFKELAEKYTNGAVKVEVYPNSQLYKDKEEIEALQLGAVQLLAPSTAKFAPLGAKEFEALDLPFIFKDDAQFQKVAKGPVAKFLMDKLEPKGIKGLAFWDNGFYWITTNRPIITPADMRGVKVRISGSKIADQYFRSVGAIPQILAFSEVYQAMQTGVVDGGENSSKFSHILPASTTAICNMRLSPIRNSGMVYPRTSAHRLTKRWKNPPSMPMKLHCKKISNP
jgi:C4-dicarboxylate-binding protein DctP